MPGTVHRILIIEALARELRQHDRLSDRKMKAIVLAAMG